VEQESSPHHHDNQEDAVSGMARSRWSWLQPVALAILSLTINLAGNDRTGLWDRDEPRYAVAVREMRARGDWIFPTFNGEPRYHKPILIYWLMGLTTSWAGDNPFGVRLVSSIAGTAAVLGVWWLGRRLFGTRGGTLAALIYATAPIVAAEAKLATTDATLALWLLGCQACLWVLSKRSSRPAAVLFWIFLNLAILTKGPVGPAFIASAAAMAWWLGWPLPPRERLHIRWGLAGLVVLSLPWYVVVTIASRGEFLRFAVGKEILHRVGSDMETHGGFPGYYPVVSALVFYPWSALLPTALAGAWARRKSDPALSYLLGWTIGPLILLECLRTKLIHYYLPAFPSCALLVAWLVLSMATEGVNIRRRVLGRLSMAMLVSVGLALAATLLAGAALIASKLSLPLFAIAFFLIIGMLVGMIRLQQGAGERAVFTLAGCWTSILLLAAGCAVPMCESFRTSRVIGERLAVCSRQSGLEPVLLEYQEPGIIYALGHTVALTRDRDGYFAHLKGGRSVLTVLLQNEIEVMRDHFGLDVKPLEQIEGFWLTKGKYQSLYIAVVRQGRSRSADELPAAMTACGAVLEQTLVK
jgi:4-amino-4-deoxy-L-arabinose transferase-like glycosyltransferase